jgi:hypothetical protein
MKKTRSKKSRDTVPLRGFMDQGPTVFYLQMTSKIKQHSNQ